MAAYTKPQKWRKEERERLRREGYDFKLMGLRFEREQVAGFRSGRRKQEFHKYSIFIYDYMLSWL